MAWLGRPYHFKVFKPFLPKILLGPFLNTLFQIITFLRLNHSIVNECFSRKPRNIGGGDSRKSNLKCNS